MSVSIKTIKEESAVKAKIENNICCISFLINNKVEIDKNTDNPKQNYYY